MPNPDRFSLRKTPHLFALLFFVLTVVALFVQPPVAIVTVFAAIFCIAWPRMKRTDGS